MLVPSFHCESMIAPVEHVGATPVFYRVLANADIDLDDIERRISSRSRAVLATHYFGFPQRMIQLRDLCDKFGLILIEDCAHAFFGRINGHPIGALGDYAIGSAMKFFPLFDGGVLLSAKHDLSNITQFRPQLLMEIKGSISVIEHAIQYKRLSSFRLPLKIALAIKDSLWGLAKKIARNDFVRNSVPASSEGGYSLDPQWISARMSRISEFILRHSEIDGNCEGRRHNYRFIVDALSTVPGMRPLFSELPDGTIPLVVPIIVNEPDRLFPALKRARVPIWRFGEYLHPSVTDDTCENSVFLSHHVFQFPCHSELTHEELTWMINAIKTCRPD